MFTVGLTIMRVTGRVAGIDEALRALAEAQR
jgi:hypothetical protein